ncbi:MAG: oxygenase MpaB family protein [Nitriliruptor sp.]|uniref:oxygenase MpaB family protein n=1 Tax=Nitriliruptor sp. TaxID=2448056 RepID=UPI0034A071FC
MREITRIDAAYEFPWDTETALSLALFRTFAVPTISRILLDSRAFTQDTRKRYDDTELLLAEVEEHGLESGRGRQAIRRVNRMHAAFPIRDVDMTYVLSTFVVEPRRWIDRYGWRPLDPNEIAAGWGYWRQLGARMGITELPDSVEEFTAWKEEFERAEFRFDPANHAVADATMTMYLREVYGVPAPLLPAARRAALALLEPELVAALGYDEPPAWVRAGVHGALRARAHLLRLLVPPRRQPYRITEVSRPTYPLGYRIDELGTFPDVDHAAKAGVRDGVAPRDVPSRVGQPTAPPR